MCVGGGGPPFGNHKAPRQVLLESCYGKGVTEKGGTGLRVTDGTDSGWGEKQEVTGKIPQGS